MQWFRMYAEAVDDGKLRVLGYEDRWHFVALLCLKSQGILDEKNQELRLQQMCVKFGMDSVELEKTMKRLVTAGLVTERWQPKNWRKRQYLSDSSTNRVRKHRETLRKRSSNAPDTEQIQNRTEQNKTRGANAPLVLHGTLPTEAWGEWLAHRRAKRWPSDPVTLRKQLAVLAEYDTESQREIIDKSINAGWQGLFPPKGKLRSTFKGAMTTEEIEAMVAERERASG